MSRNWLHNEVTTTDWDLDYHLNAKSLLWDLIPHQNLSKTLHSYARFKTWILMHQQPQNSSLHRVQFSTCTCSAKVILQHAPPFQVQVEPRLDSLLNFFLKCGRFSVNSAMLSITLQKKKKKSISNQNLLILGRSVEKIKQAVVNCWGIIFRSGRP